MSNPFDYINSISYNKKNIMRETDNDELAEKGYVPFLVNRGLSYYPDTIFYSNEMNMRHSLDNKLAYEYYLNSIRPRKRFSKWFKKENDDVIEVVMNYYKCSYSKALQYARVLTEDQITIIKKRLSTGDDNGFSKQDGRG